MDDEVEDVARVLLRDDEHAALDGERVAGLGALDRDRPGERVHAVPVEPVDVGRRGLERDLVVADVARVHDDGVAGLEPGCGHPGGVKGQTDRGLSLARGR